jgi:hypothetical protein
VGAPGSGKSTFSSQLISGVFSPPLAHSAAPHASGPEAPGPSSSSTGGGSGSGNSGVIWCHVNQDSIRGGKKGTRQECIAAAQRALLAGTSCVVDRCNCTEVSKTSVYQLTLGQTFHPGP